MTRDVCYYFEKSYVEVYNAFLCAAREKFGRDCKQEEGKILSFGLNFSFRYNMNGGALRIFFMPYATCTAVNLHYIIAQLCGARYGAHAKALVSYVESILNVKGVETRLNVNAFLAYTPATGVAMPADKTAVSAKQRICPKCRRSISMDSSFCQYCGENLTQARFCVNCGKPYQEGDRFCTGCGTKR